MIVDRLLAEVYRFDLLKPGEESRLSNRSPRASECLSQTPHAEDRRNLDRTAPTAAGFGMDRDQAIAVAVLIQTQQIIPVTLIGVALAPEFILKRKKVMRAEDDGLTLPSRPETAADSAVGPTRTVRPK